jgi:Rrf2 family cysteine metabolism transcriptional repressor
MLSLSAKARYGLQAAYDLALHAGDGPRQAREVAADQGIPQHFLEQVLVQLKRALLVRSYRGSHGGYALARDPAQISVLEVLTCLEGPLELGDGPWSDEVLAIPLQRAAAGVSRALQVSLADLVWDKQRSQPHLTYQI